MDEQTKRPTESSTEKKKSYHSPQLADYGSLRELTTSAPASNSDLPASGGQAFLMFPEG